MMIWDWLGLMQLAARALLESVVLSLVVVAIIGAVTLVRGVSPAMRHICWSAATIVPPLVFVAAMAGAIYVDGSAVTQVHAVAIAAPPVIDPLDLPLQRATQPVSQRTVNAAGGSQYLLNAPPTLHAFAATASWVTLAIVVWFGVTLFALLRILAAVARGQWLARIARRSGMPASEEATAARVVVAASDVADTPIAIGFFHRLVLVPEALIASLPPDELRSVTAHEVAHLVRRDDWRDLAERLACAVMWINPFVLIAARAARVWRERACDHWAAERVGRRPLASALWRSASLMGGAQPRHTVLAFTRGESLLERVKALVRPRPISLRGTVLAGVALCVTLLATGAVVMARMLLFSPSYARVIPTGAMHDGRAEFAVATLHGDDSLLVAGGLAGPGRFLRTAERYDAARGTFAQVGSLPEPIAGAVATTLADGRVLLTGGWTAHGATSDAEVFEPASGRIVAVAPLLFARSGHTATLLPTGDVLIAGGTGANRAATASAEMFDQRTLRFSAVAPMTHARSEQTATLLRDGRVLLAGGFDGRAGLRSTELYEPRRQRFVAGPPMTVARARAGAVMLTDGSVLIAGGSRGASWHERLRSTERYDPVGHRFTAAGALLEPIVDAGSGMLLLPNDDVMILGVGTEGEIYHHRHNRFTAIAGSEGTGRTLGAAALLDTCGALVFGGFDAANTAHASAAAYRVE
jgi:beta-lactamase regulating signal transducer with metallopeptidase domain